MSKRIIQYLGDRPEVMIVLGKNYVQNPEHPSGWELSPISKLNALAVARMYKSVDYLEKIIISGGDTREIGTSEAEDMMNYILQEIPDFPRDIFLLDGKAMDTRTNALNIREIVDRERIEKLDAETVGYHLERSLYVLEKRGKIIVPGKKSEELLLEYAPEMKEQVEEWLNSEFTSQDMDDEKRAKLLTSVPFIGPELVSMAAKVFRGR